MMTTKTDLSTQPKKRITTYSKAFRKKSLPPTTSTSLTIEQKDDKVSSAAPEPSVWDFQDDDEISAPFVTQPMKKLKQYGRKPESKLRQQPVPLTLPRRQTEQPVNAEEVVKTRKRRISTSERDSRGPAERTYSTPASSPTHSPSLKLLPAPPLETAEKPVKSRPVAKATYSRSSKANSAKDAIIKESVADSMPFPPNTVKTFKSLSVNNPKQKLFQQQIPFRPTQGMRSTQVPTPRQEKALTSNPIAATQSKSPAKKRRRLIDTLAEQADDALSSSEGEEEEKEESSQDAMRSTELQDMPTFSTSSPPSSNPELSRRMIYTRQDSAKKIGGPKFTYRSQRSILAEDSALGGMAPGGDDLLLNESLLPPSASQFDMDDEDDEPFTTGAVRSIHELRQAGANSRFADQMQDLLERVGRASRQTTSGRRNALLELALQLQDKSFSRQFRDHNGDDGLFVQLGKENDMIAGYASIAILTTLLATTTSAHIIRQLRGQGFALLLARLLAIPSDITLLAKERKSNLSRHGQESVAKLKASLLKLTIWDPVSPSTLSPRRLALKALDLVDEHSSGVSAGDEFYSSEVTDSLFSVLSNASDQRYWDFPGQDVSIDFYLALSLLESHSIQATQTDSKEQWTAKHLPIVADTLGTTLQHNSGPLGLGAIGVLVLKLTLNATNNTHDASAAFVEKGILRTLAGALCDTFKSAMNMVTDKEVFPGLIESLLLMLGVMINFAEHDPSAGRALSASQISGVSPLDRLIKLFLDHHVATSEADSVEKSQLNVAFGYLSILLGYLSLHGPVRKRFGSMQKVGNLDPLLNSIREFIAYHKVADDVMDDDGNASRPYSNLAVKLQELVEKLECRF